MKRSGLPGRLGREMAEKEGKREEPPAKGHKKEKCSRCWLVHCVDRGDVPQMYTYAKTYTFNMQHLFSHVCEAAFSKAQKEREMEGT